jgi:ubiquinol-cytochrome c reductase cytochrome c1 subunit
MIRIFSILAGLAFSFVLALSFVFEAIGTAKEGLPNTVESNFVEHPHALKLASDGLFGKFDKQQLQRGFAVYQGVCQNCHALKFVAFRDLKALGYDDDEVKAIAKQYQVPAYNAATGEVKTQPGKPTDHFPPVVYGGKGAPPDLSLITKSRHGGAAYVHSLLLGYKDQQGYKNEKGLELLKAFPDAKTPDGLFFNPYFANLNIAMPPPLTADGQVTYAPGNPPATKEQMAQDVAAFLVWTAEPNLAERHEKGWPVVLFLLLATVLAYMAKRNVWADKH